MKEIHLSSFIDNKYQKVEFSVIMKKYKQLSLIDNDIYYNRVYIGDTTITNFYQHQNKLLVFNDFYIIKIGEGNDSSFIVLKENSKSILITEIGIFEDNTFIFFFIDKESKMKMSLNNLFIYTNKFNFFIFYIQENKVSYLGRNDNLKYFNKYIEKLVETENVLEKIRKRDVTINDMLDDIVQSVRYEKLFEI